MAKRAIGGIQRVADRLAVQSRAVRSAPAVNRSGLGNRDFTAPLRPPRIIIQFDDGHVTNYTVAWPILQSFRYVGSFGIITQNTDVDGGSMTGQMLKNLVQAGCTLQDHTKDHDAAKWGNPAQIATWRTDTQFSKNLFASLGLVVKVWNQPGGAGEQWTPELGVFLRAEAGYDWVAGSVDQDPATTWENFHPGMLDTPLRCGRWVFSWGANAPAQGWTWQAEVESIWGKVVNAWAVGVIPQMVFHNLVDPEPGLGLTELCTRIRAAGAQPVTFDEAVRLMLLPHETEYGQNLAPNLTKDLNNDGFVEGFNDWHWPGLVSVALDGATNSGVETKIFGPLPGKLAVSMLIKEAGTYTLNYTLYRIGSSYNYTTQLIQIAHPGGTKFTDLLDIGPTVDRVKISITSSGAFHLQSFTAVPLR
jgi:Polysaccharide deacetylase